jgi:hypothetical protein
VDNSDNTVIISHVAAAKPGKLACATLESSQHLIERSVLQLFEAQLRMHVTSYDFLAKAENGIDQQSNVALQEHQHEPGN